MRRLQLAAFVFALLAITLLVGGLSYVNYQRFHHEAEANASNLAEIISDDLDESLERARSDLRGFAEIIKAGDLESPVDERRRADVEAAMAAQLVNFPQMMEYRAFSADGTSRFNVGHSPASINVSDRDWFRKLRTDRSQSMVMSDVLSSKSTGTPVLVLAMALRAPDGRFLGAANAVVDLTHFQRLIEGPQIGAHGAITIRRSDTLRLILRRPQLAGLVNQVASTPVTEAVSSGRQTGTIDFKSPFDGLVRTNAFRVANYSPLYVIVSLAPDDYLKPWVYETRVAATLALGCQALLAALFFWQRRTQRQLKEDLQRKLRDKQAIVEARDRAERAAAELQDHRDHLEDVVAERTRLLVLAKTAAEAANVAKSAFLANMSHEIRTPLNAVAGMAHLIRGAGLTPDQGVHLDKLEAASDHLLKVLDAILLISKIDAGGVHLAKEAFSVPALLDSVVDLVRADAQATQVAVTVECEPIPFDAIGDPTWVRQALLNLTSNAIKFAPNGSVRLGAHVVEENGEGALLRFEVQDTGIGIDPLVLQRMFEPFEQADNTPSRAYGGTGLGLAITRRLARLMGGEAGADSVPGAGSTFWFTTRAGRAAALPVAVTPAAPAPVSARDALQRQFAGTVVLVAEDEAINREITQVLLEKAGLVVETAEDGVEAVQRARDGTCALILMDMMMPQMDGLQATGQIRELKRTRTIPILALTANAFDEDRQRCLEAGMNDFITKPLLPQDLYTLLLKWLSVAPMPA